MGLHDNMRNSWVMAHWVVYLERQYPEIHGTIEEYAERLDPEFDKNLAPATLVETIWSSLQNYLDKPREPGWHRRVYGGWPSNKASAMQMADEMRQDAATLWNMGASRESAELIRAAEASRQLSYFVQGLADGNTALLEDAIKQLVVTCPNIDYEFSRVFPKWNELAQAVNVQINRQNRVFTDAQAPLKDD